LAAAERRYRDVHRKRLVAVREIAAGETLTAENAALRRAETAADCSTADLPLALGRRAARAIPQYSPIGMKDLKMKIVAVLACRAESSRLYGKPLQLVGDRPIIQHLLDRLAQVKSLDGICLAISQGPSAEIFIDYARKRQLDYVVGPEKDVLGRLILGADHCGADVILRTTTENPYTYWENIDDLIRLHVEKGADLTVTEKLPLGTLVEIISVDALKRSHKFGEDRHRSELCSMFIAEHPEAFVIQRVAPPEKLCRPEIRLTVDTPYDLVFVRTLWEALHQPDRLIRLEEIVDFCDAHPEVAKMNAGEQTLYLWK
jgi:spore coat polysaccharide biosynthesis protein SpsF